MGNFDKDWTKWILPKVTENSREGEIDSDKTLRTTDFITVKSFKEAEEQSSWERQKSLTDFAILTGGYQSDVSQTLMGKRGGGVLLRTPSYGGVCSVDSSGRLTWMWARLKTTNLCVCPSLSLDATNIPYLEVEKARVKNGKFVYYTVEFGEFPKTKESFYMQQKLEWMYNEGHLREGLKCTGKLYTTLANSPLNEGVSSRQNPEFEFDGKRYVRVIPSISCCEPEFSNGTKYGGEDYMWVRVEPITFRVTNYKNFIKGKEKNLELESEEGILSGIAVYPQADNGNDVLPQLQPPNSTMWQNSMLRAYLNSSKTSEMDGNLDFQAPHKWDFTDRGLLYQAFNVTRPPIKEYIVTKDEQIICEHAFSGCVGIEKIVIPPHVKEIGGDAFSGCNNTLIYLQSPSGRLKLTKQALDGVDYKFIYVTKDGKDLILSPKEDISLDNECFKCGFDLERANKFCDCNYRDNFVKLMNWKAGGKIKFIPPEYTIQIFPSSQMKKYFINNNNQRWSKLVKTLEFDKLEEVEKNNCLVDLMKIYYALGGFSENQGESERAFDYVLKYVATTRTSNQTPKQIGEEVHRRFSKIQLNGAYNPMFAKFFMRYYHKNPDFMNFSLENGNGELMEEKDYLCMGHNAFDRIMKNYPNRVVEGNQTRSLLSPYFVAQHSMIKIYYDVDEGNELLADMVGRYGYSQEAFEHIQNIYNRAKSIKNKYIISADRGCEDGRIRFRILEKDDPLGFILGDLTNCCQHIGGAGESCVDDGYTNPNAGFLVFEETQYGENDEERTRLLGQAYVWYDPQTKTVCYDNIEIPTKILNELNRKERKVDGVTLKGLMDSVVQSAEAILHSMNRRGFEVKKVTTGRAYNDLKDELENRFGPCEESRALHRGYTGYSDAKHGQYVIMTYDENTKSYATGIRELEKIIRSDLNEINMANQNFNEVEGV